MQKKLESVCFSLASFSSPISVLNPIFSILYLQGDDNPFESIKLTDKAPL
jgi:hypothetical protein